MLSLGGLVVLHVLLALVRLGVQGLDLLHIAVVGAGALRLGGVVILTVVVHGLVGQVVPGVLHPDVQRVDTVVEGIVLPVAQALIPQVGVQALVLGADVLGQQAQVHRHIFVLLQPAAVGFGGLQILDLGLHSLHPLGQLVDGLGVGLLHGQLAGLVADGLAAQQIQGVLQPVIQLVNAGGQNVEFVGLQLAVHVLGVDLLGVGVQVVPDVVDGLAVQIVLVLPSGVGGGGLQFGHGVLGLFRALGEFLQGQVLRLGVGLGVEADGLSLAVPLHLQVHGVAQGPDGQIGGAVVGDGVDDVAVFVQQGLLLPVHLDGDVGTQVGGDPLNGGGARRA